MTMGSVTTPSTAFADASYRAAEPRLGDLQRMGAAYAALGLAIAWTRSNTGPDTKVCSTGWDRVKRSTNVDMQVGLLKRAVRKNPALVTRNSGIIGVDIDGDQAALHLQRITPNLPDTITVLSGRAGGEHRWFAPPDGWTGCKVEVQETGTVTIASNGYLLVPPALHENGRVYRFAPDRAPWEVGLATLPAVAMDALAAAAGETRTRQAQDGGPIPDGERNTRLTALAGAVRRHGATQGEMLALLVAVNRGRCKPPLENEELEAIAASVARYAPADIDGTGVPK
ncbi:MAG: bifunctional DNA primase/polymerase [Thermoleophilia bacterium]